MRSKSYMLPASIAFLVLGIASSLVAQEVQEVSHQVNVQASHLNVRKTGEAMLANSLRSRAEASVSRELTRVGNESLFSKMHSEAHHWGRVMAQKKAGFAALQQASLPSVKALPIIGPDKGFTGFAALTGAEQASVSGFDLEPPDQGMCTDGNVVLEAINVAASVYDATTHKELAGPVYLNDFFGVAATDFTSDPRCYYDPSTQRWFVTMTDLGPPTGVPTDLLLAVSQSSDPTGTYSLYEIDTTADGFIGACPCFGDQPLIGSDNNGFYISTNSFGATSFGGAQIYALSKFALVLGISPFGVHITPLPSPGGVPFPFSLQPSISPDGNGAAENGGTEYFVSTYDDFSLENHRVSVWAMTETDTLNAEVGIPGFTTLAVNTENYALPVVASQKPGPIPLGKSMGQPEGTLDPGDERMQQVVYADGHLWSSVGTALQVGGNTLDGAAYFVIKPLWPNGVLKASVTRQGYVASENNNLLYPAIGVSEMGNGAMVFTLTGPNYFPSAAYIPIRLSGGVAADIRLAAAGSKPDDGFTCYPSGGGPPGRWGDYSAAVAVGTDTVWIATEYISKKKRDQFTNWGTFIGSLPLP
jgi:hypothetical protein